MTKVSYRPDKDYWSGSDLPRPWDYDFEEAHMNVEAIAAELKNIMVLLGYLPCQVEDVFHPELIKEWGYDLAKDDDN
jgi:hypothetical protein